METMQQQRKFVLRTTCLKNGGFRHYMSLPPQSVFQNACWVLGSELDVKVKRKKTFFNRESEWMRLPVYLTTNKGLLFIYTTDRTGYVLRVASASRVEFEGVKKSCKMQSPQDKPFDYTASMVLHFIFGELHIRFSKNDKLRPWRTILLAAHESQTELAKIGEMLAQEIKPAVSLESVVSTNSNFPTKRQPDEIVVHRHPRQESMESVPNVNSPPQGTEQATSNASPTSLDSDSSKHSESKIDRTSSMHMRARIEDFPTIPTRKRRQRKVRQNPKDSEVDDRRREMIKHSVKPPSDPVTSEVDVSCKDINQFNASITSLHGDKMNFSPLRPEVKHASALSLASNGNPFLDEETGGSGTDDQNNYAPDVEVMQNFKRLPSIRRVTFASDPMKPSPPRAAFPRTPLPKPAQIPVAERAQHSKVMDFWRKKENETGESPIQVKKVSFKDETAQKHSSGKVFNSPSKYFASDEASPVGAAPFKSAQIRSESKI